MSQISLKSISGITSITTPAGVDNQFTLHTNNTSQALKLDSAGNIHIHNHVNTTGVSTASNFKTGTSNLHSAGLNAAYVDVDDFVDVGSNIKLGNAGVITATSYRGDGSQLTGIVADKIFEGNTEVETIDTGSNGHVKITTEGTERLRITSGGSIGIGTDDPQQDVHILRSQLSRVRIESTSTTHNSDVIFQNPDGLLGVVGYNATLDTINIDSRGGTNGITFTRTGSEKLRITSDGSIELKTDGRGIQFPTTQTPTNANTNRVGISSEMRYYESGTFVPGLSSTVLNGLQLPAFTDNSYTRRVGRYVRIGNVVHLTVEILMAGSVTYANGSTSTAPPCIIGVTPFKYTYSNRYAVSGHPDYYPCSVSYSSTGLDNDTLYATLRRDYNAEARIEITKPGTGGSRQYNSTNFGEVFPANAMINVSCTYIIDTSNADF